MSQQNEGSETAVVSLADVRRSRSLGDVRRSRSLGQGFGGDARSATTKQKLAVAKAAATADSKTTSYLVQVSGPIVFELPLSAVAKYFRNTGDAKGHVLEKSSLKNVESYIERISFVGSFCSGDEGANYKVDTMFSVVRSAREVEGQETPEGSFGPRFIPIDFCEAFTTVTLTVTIAHDCASESGSEGALTEQTARQLLNLHLNCAQIAIARTVDFYAGRSPLLMAVDALRRSVRRSEKMIASYIYCGIVSFLASFKVGITLFLTSKKEEAGSGGDSDATENSSQGVLANADSAPLPPHGHVISFDYILEKKSKAEYLAKTGETEK